MKEERQLLHQLKMLRPDDPYPFHMPGHKRRQLPFANPYDIDITEIDGFDNLHRPEGILQELEQRYADLYGCDVCNLSVGGSTDMLLTTIAAATKPGDRVLIARNCHKAVYHGAILRQLDCRYLYPEISEEGICGPIDPDVLASVLEEEKRQGRSPKAMVITSPTYEGVCSDVKKIASICHSHEVTLIIDAAHGSHLGLRKDQKRMEDDFPENPIQQGADAVVVSLHKTLPSFTQTAALLMKKDSRIAKWRIQKYFDYYETSSPSYILMAGMDACCRFLEEEGDETLPLYVKRLQNIRSGAKGLNKVRFWEREDWTVDPGKLVITAEGMSGSELMDYFRQKNHLELEMCSLGHALAMTSMMDTDEGLNRLLEGMKCLDRELSGREKRTGRQVCDEKQENRKIYLYDVRPEQKLPISCAESKETQWVPLEEATGRVAGGLWSIYPPGIPLLVPGEYVSEEIVTKLKEAKKQGLTLDGCSENGEFPVIIEE
ncbi:Arginine/lysine/ornithine decarboxylase [Lachnospiraceae bacterium KHCPX20]|nr:Arginine/lysine/ornithine decarboxylase [Lachnospiraceae bacterium KHCPX20]